MHKVLAERAARAVARGLTAVEDEMRRDNCHSGLSSVVVQDCIVLHANVEPQAVEQGWVDQSPVHSACAAAKRLDGDLVGRVSCRSSSQSILLVRQDRGLVDRTSSLRCSPGSTNFVTSKMRAVVCEIVVLPSQSSHREARQRGNGASKEWVSTRLNVHDVFALLPVDANFTRGLGWAVCFRGFARPHVTCCLRATTPSVTCTVHLLRTSSYDQSQQVAYIILQSDFKIAAG